MYTLELIDYSANFSSAMCVPNVSHPRSVRTYVLVFTNCNMMSFKTKISLITPSYNDAKNLNQCLHSILRQGISDIEWIIVDDGSIDETSDMVKHFISIYTDITIIYHYIPNSGACSARNIGYKLSSGEYIKFLDADDALEDGHLASLLKEITASNLDVVIGSTIERYIYKNRYIDKRLDEYITRFYLCDSNNSIVSKFIKKPLFHHSSILANRKIIDKIKGWDEKILADQDGDFLFRLFMASPKFSFIQSPCFIYKIDLSSSNRITNDTQEKLLSRYLNAEKIRRILLRTQTQTEENLSLKYTISRKYLSIIWRASSIDQNLFKKAIFKKNILQRSKDNINNNNFLFKLKNFIEISLLNILYIRIFKILRSFKLKLKILIIGSYLGVKSNV